MIRPATRCFCSGILLLLCDLRVVDLGGTVLGRSTEMEMNYNEKVGCFFYLTLSTGQKLFRMLIVVSV